jgi:uncharacterized protein YegP (UPF0339 family)
MQAKFVLRKRGGKFGFDLVAGNGVAIAKSVAYASKRTAMNGIKSIQTAAKAIDDATGGEAASKKPVAKKPIKVKAAAKKTPAKKAAVKRGAATAAIKNAGAKRTPARGTIKRAAAKPAASKAPVKKAVAKTSTAKRTTLHSHSAPVSARPRTAGKAAGFTAKRTAATPNRATNRAR